MQILIDELIKNSADLGLNSKRLFHGRGKCFSGFENIVIDWFAPYVLVDIYNTQENLQKILTIIKNNLANRIEGIVCRNRRSKPLDCYAFYGIVPDKHFSYWNGLKFEIDFKSNQNIGYFLDSENIRLLVSQRSKEKKILNLFSYTCSLSVVAKKYGAKSIMNVDMNKNALKVGQKNHFLSDLDTKSISFNSYNIMKSLSGLTKKGKWDLIIVDPPSSQGKNFNIERDYEKLIKSLSNWCSSNCELILCLNSPFQRSSWITDLCSNHLPNFYILDIFYSPIEFIEKDKELGVKIVHLTNI